MDETDLLVVGEAEDVPLFFTWISILDLLSNYDQEICLIHVGTEGASCPSLRRSRTARCYSPGTAVSSYWRNCSISASKAAMT